MPLLAALIPRLQVCGDAILDAGINPEQDPMRLGVSG